MTNKSRVYWIVAIVLFGSLGVVISFLIATSPVVTPSYLPGEIAFFAIYLFALLIIVTFYTNRKYLSKTGWLFFIIYSFLFLYLVFALVMGLFFN